MVFGNYPRLGNFLEFDFITISCKMFQPYNIGHGEGDCTLEIREIKNMLHMFNNQRRGQVGYIIFENPS